VTLLAVAVVTSLFAVQSVARVAEGPAFRPPNETHHLDSDRALWSGDPDGLDANTVHNWTTRDSARAELAASTDVSFNRPPAEVAAWNRETHQDFPDSGQDTSIAPTGATFEQGRFVRDAYVEIFTVQPATTARITDTRTTRYVATEGNVLATGDHRVALPEDVELPFSRVTWQLENHTVSATKLLVDDDQETTSSEPHTPILQYDLGDDPGTEHTLTVESNVSVTLKRTFEWCSNYTMAGNCTQWSRESTNLTENVTVTDSTTVTEYTLHIGGYYARYPNGDLGLVLFKSDPWLGYELPGGRVNGVWRFYSARDSGWDSLVARTDSGASTRHSPAHPLRVTAFPLKTGPTAAPAENVSILRVHGEETQPARLPERVHLDALDRPYTASYSLATVFETPEQGVSDLTAYGLVRGVETTGDEGVFEEIEIHRSNLTLTVEETTSETATVTVRLRDAKTGEPIETDGREGYVVLAGERVQTGRDGTVRTTLPRPPGSISARFEPGPWWLHTTGYVGDDDAATVEGTALALVRSLYRASIPIGMVLLAAFLVDRITGMPVWPPWRGL